MIYYPPRQSTFSAFLEHPLGTVPFMVGSKSEFWLWLCFHIIAVALCKSVAQVESVDAFNWKVGAIMQYFLAFCGTFFNNSCVERFFSLYEACCSLNDSVVMMVQEMSISLHTAALRPHREAATKYLLAATHEFYAMTVGGTPSAACWRGLVQRGMLTDEDVDVLKRFPPGMVTPVLVTWVALVIQEAVVHDTVWDSLSQPSPHIHDRLRVHLTAFMRAGYCIGHMVAMPVPFVYYHMVDAVLLTNMFMLGTVPALLRNWFTLIPFAIALMILMGLREIWASWADPFGEDVLDFPVPAFVNHCFDRAVCFLESFADPGVRLRVLRRANDETAKSGVELDYVREFSQKELRRPCKKGVFYNDDQPLGEGPFAWTRKVGLSHLSDNVDAVQCLRESLVEHRRDVERKSVTSRRLQASADAEMAASLDVALAAGWERLAAVELELRDAAADLRDIISAILDQATDTAHTRHIVDDARAAITHIEENLLASVGHARRRYELPHSSSLSRRFSSRTPRSTQSGSHLSIISVGAWPSAGVAMAAV